MKLINTSTFDFPRLITGGYLYVDKTAQLYELARPETDYIYYLPRPRRFGKSLMISTYKALFQGRRELFKGLAIEKTDWDWDKEVYPVLHLDMSQTVAANSADFRSNLNSFIKSRCRDFEVDFDPSETVEANFRNLLEGLAKKSPNGKYVLLIDEYDAPIAGMLDSDDGRRELVGIRKTLHDFYIQAKAHCGDMRFLMVTGVSKFAKTSIFSAFNNPVDLSLDARAADIVGYTHEEMEKYFHEHIQAFADYNGMTYEKAFAELLRWYDGYQFSPDRMVKVINPVSLGRALSNRRISNYWEATAGSTLIFDALKAKNAAPIDYARKFRVKRLDAPDALDASVEALLYQGGYLTIDKMVDGDTVVLRMPNEEVRDSLYDGFLASIFGRDFGLDDFEFTAEETAKELVEDELGGKFTALLKTAFAKVPHEWLVKDERIIKQQFLSFMVFARAEIVGEEQHSLGRPDAVLKTEKAIYIIEFKYGASSAAALAQCRDKHYADAYTADPRRIVYIGANYNPKDRTFDNIATEVVKE